MTEQSERPELKDSTIAASQFIRLGHKLQEHFAVLTIDAHARPIGLHVVALGTADRVVAHPRDIFRVAITDHAVSIMIAHNHPSGSIMPSEEDVKFIHRIVKAGDILGIPVMDSFIIAGDQAISMKELGCLGDESEKTDGKKLEVADL